MCVRQLMKLGTPAQSAKSIFERDTKCQNMKATSYTIHLGAFSVTKRTKNMSILLSFKENMENCIIKTAVPLKICRDTQDLLSFIRDIYNIAMYGKEENKKGGITKVWFRVLHCRYKR